MSMRGQGHVSNGPKESLDNGDDFTSWRAHHHQGYNQPMPPAAPMNDPYGYYGTPFSPYPQHAAQFPSSDHHHHHHHHHQSPGGAAWSNGDPSMTFLGGYGAQPPIGPESYPLDGMFGPSTFGGFGQPNFGYGFPGNAEFHGQWGGLSRPKPYEDVYYREQMYNPPTHNPPVGTAPPPELVNHVELERNVRHMEHSMADLSLNAAPPCVQPVATSPTLENKDRQQQRGHANQKKTTWASIASQPAKPQPKGRKGGSSSSPGLPIGTWESKSGKPGVIPPPPAPRSSTWSSRAPPPMPQEETPSPTFPIGGSATAFPPPQAAVSPNAPIPPRPATPDQLEQHQQQQHQQQHQQKQHQQQPHHPNRKTQQQSPVENRNEDVEEKYFNGPESHEARHAILDTLQSRNNYNPSEFDMSAAGARFFVIKSYSEDDIHRSIKYEIWCSTEHGNKRLDQAFRERENKGPIYLFFSVNSSGHFCGMAQMMSQVDYNSSSSVWAQDKWKGSFKVRWIYVKDVPNGKLRHIKLENNENKPVTNSRDTQEVPHDKGVLVLREMHNYKHTTSIFDDFVHYEQRQLEEEERRLSVTPLMHLQTAPPPSSSSSQPPPAHGKGRRGNADSHHNDEVGGGRNERRRREDYRDSREPRDHQNPHQQHRDHRDSYQQQPREHHNRDRDFGRNRDVNYDSRNGHNSHRVPLSR
ncbi:unnamed protein product [Notodromas monacha]|uniref:YTH domain-containing protein n=1 Tax=Notodromas monacha TaxID=399045 RepID=A0A7R9BFJ7_9CRUS|nr:unnamed protein product [Notodromas monacha]CAG0914356.1 unnamed protein product [Notodromas monacha]